jgi:hypothetical protein
MKKVLFWLLGAVVLIGLLAGAGVAGYRIGRMQATDGTAPQFGQSDRFTNPDKMPQFRPSMNDHGFNPGPGQGFGGPHIMMNRGRGFGFFSPFRFLFHIALLGLVIWFGYKLFKGNGWQLSLTRQAETVETNQTPDSAPKKKSAKSRE